MMKELTPCVLVHEWWHPWLAWNRQHKCGFIQLPTWEEWGLSVCFTSEEPIEAVRRGVVLQSLVTGVLRNSPDKAAQYLDGKLHYYTIVEELEAVLGRRLCEKGAA